MKSTGNLYKLDSQRNKIKISEEQSTAMITRNNETGKFIFH